MTILLGEHHRRLLLGQAAGGLVLNFFLNGGAAWATFPPLDELPLWARGNAVAGDTIGTSFFLPLMTCLILTPIVRRALRDGAMPGIDRGQLPGALRFWPANFVGRGALVGLICALTIALATLALLTAAGVEAMTRGQVTVYKAVYTAVLGAIVTPLFGWRALADGSRAAR
jgi:hypothetical protein